MILMKARHTTLTRRLLLKYRATERLLIRETIQTELRAMDSMLVISFVSSLPSRHSTRG